MYKPAAFVLGMQSCPAQTACTQRRCACGLLIGSPVMEVRESEPQTASSVPLPSSSQSHEAITYV